MANRFFGSRPAALLGVFAVAAFVAMDGSRGSRGVHVVLAQGETASQPRVLTIGSQAPDFHLPGIDGKTYSLDSFKAAKAFVVIFTAVHCPTAEVYENRIKQLVADYRGKGVAFVAIQPNNAEAVRLDEMGYTDLGDSLQDMKLRAEHRKFNFPFLYDGEKQLVSRAYGPVATPHMFVFDRERKLRYQGRIDSNPREAYAKVADTRDAIEAVLAGKPVATENTPTVGCSIKWIGKSSANTELARFAKEPVTLEKIGAEGLKALRQNATEKTVLVNFWATWCAPCTAEIPDLLKTWRMYRKRPFDLVTVSINYPDEEKAVRKFLEAQLAASRNYISATMDPYELMRAFDPAWNGGVPYSMVIAPGGRVLYKGTGVLDILKTRRLILASFPDDDYVGQNAYWNGK
jgi:peroxiredoxin